MPVRKFIAYYRVSTARQGQSGLGLEAQQDAVHRYLAGCGCKLLSEHQEVETAKGADALQMRPQLRAALDECRKHGATLLIAKLDRLARNVHFVSGLMESRVRFVACDMPEANELTIHIMAAFAEHEAKRISQRTKDALAVAKARGVKLGIAGPNNLRPNIDARKEKAAEFASKIRPVITRFVSDGLTQREIVGKLNELGIPAPMGGQWRLTQVQRVMARSGEGGFA